MAARFVGNNRFNYGFVTSEEANGRVRMTFITGHLTGICRWLLMYGSAVEIEGPDKLKETMEGLVEEIVRHYKPALVN